VLANHFLTAAIGLGFRTVLVSRVRPDVSSENTFLLVVIMLAAFVARSSLRAALSLDRRTDPAGLAGRSP
jgi:hypothetical protein